MTTLNDAIAKAVRGIQHPEEFNIGSRGRTDSHERTRQAFTEEPKPTICYRCHQPITGAINWQHVGGHGDKPYCDACLAEKPEGAER